MTKPVRFTKAELANAAKVAKEYGVSLRLHIDGSILVNPAAMTEDDDIDAELERFKDKR